MHNDPKSIQRKVAIAIHGNRISEALKLIINSPSSIKETLLYEQAYCNYRLNHFDQCLETLKILEKNSKGLEYKILELRAQAYFRQRHYQDAYDTYMSLMKKGVGSQFNAERELNLVAIVVSAQLEAPNTLKTNPKCFEQLPSIEEIIESIDILSLEDENWFVGTKYTKKSGSNKKGSGKRQTILDTFVQKQHNTTKNKSKSNQKLLKNDQQDQNDEKENENIKKRNQKRKIKRKKKLPQKLDPAGPDPERWLPKWQRASYANARRKERKDRNKQGGNSGGAGGDPAIRGTQGAVSEADAVPMAKTNKTAAPVAGANHGPRQMRPVAQKKKKKTGRR